MDGKDVAGRERELHGQVRGGDDDAKGIEGRTAQEDIVGGSTIRKRIGMVLVWVPSRKMVWRSM